MTCRPRSCSAEPPGYCHPPPLSPTACGPVPALWPGWVLLYLTAGQMSWVRYLQDYCEFGAHRQQSSKKQDSELWGKAEVMCKVTAESWSHQLIRGKKSKFLQDFWVLDASFWVLFCCPGFALTAARKHMAHLQERPAAFSCSTLFLGTLVAQNQVPHPASQASRIFFTPLPHTSGSFRLQTWPAPFLSFTSVYLFTVPLARCIFPLKPYSRYSPYFKVSFRQSNVEQ